MSPILGIWASAQQDANVPNSYESIATVTVGATSVNQITFSSIPQTYTHLQLRWIGRSSSTNPEATILQFNNDTSGSYGWGNHRIEGSGSTATAGNGGGQPYTAMFLNSIPPTNSTANVFSSGVIDILDYKNTNKNKVARGLGGYDANGSGYLNLSSGAYFKTDAITSISITITTGYNYLQYSQFALYGIKS
jgi:hypothetical protein